MSTQGLSSLWLSTGGFSALPNSSARTGSMPQTKTAASALATGFSPVFPKKGPRKHGKPEKTLSSEISRQRATVMEGVFGIHKEYYGLRKIRVEGEKREKLMIFFGIMAANAVKIAKRRAEKENLPHQKAA